MKNNLNLKVNCFQQKEHLGGRGPNQGRFFCMGGFLGEGSNFGQASKAGLAASKPVFFVWLRWGKCKLYSFTLYSCKGSLGDCLGLVWG